MSRKPVKITDLRSTCHNFQVWSENFKNGLVCGATVENGHCCEKYQTEVKNIKDRKVYPVDQIVIQYEDSLFVPEPRIGTTYGENPWHYTETKLKETGTSKIRVIREKDWEEKQSSKYAQLEYDSISENPQKTFNFLYILVFIFIAAGIAFLLNLYKLI